MTNSLVRGLERIGRWWYLGVTVLFFAVLNVVVLSQVSRFEEMTGGVLLLEVPNMVFEDLYAVASRYPEEVVRLYQQVLLPLDVLLPVSTGALFVVALAVLTTRLFPATSRWRYLPLLGVLVTLLDWSENIGVFFILRTIEDPVAGLDLLTRLLSATKFVAALGSILLVVVLLAALLVRNLRRRFSATELK